MADNNLDITRNYSDDRPLTKDIIDQFLDDIKVWADIEVRNTKQMLLDIFSEGYALDHDGIRNYSKSLQDQMRLPNQFEMFFDFNEAAGVLQGTDYHDIYWMEGGSNGSINVREDANGTVRIATEAAVSDPYLEYRLDNLDPLLSTEIEFYCKVDSIANLELYLGLYADSNNYAYFSFNTTTSAVNIYAVTKTSAGEVSSDTGVDLSASTYFKFRIKIESLFKVRFWINDIEVVPNHTGQISSSAALKPRFWIKNKSSAVINLDVDYIRILQDRSVI